MAPPTHFPPSDLPIHAPPTLGRTSRLSPAHFPPTACSFSLPSPPPVAPGGATSGDAPLLPSAHPLWAPGHLWAGHCQLCGGVNKEGVQRGQGVVSAFRTLGEPRTAEPKEAGRVFRGHPPPFLPWGCRKQLETAALRGRREQTVRAVRGGVCGIFRATTVQKETQESHLRLRNQGTGDLGRYEHGGSTLRFKDDPRFLGGRETRSEQI